MSKKKQYRISIEHIGNPDGSVPEDAVVAFDFDSHDELFAIIKELETRPDVGPDAAARLGLGIKLFGSVMLEKRSSDLFADLFPHFSAFMKKLKGSAAQN